MRGSAHCRQSIKAMLAAADRPDRSGAGQHGRAILQAEFFRIAIGLLRAGDQLAKFGRIIGARTSEDMYRLLSSIDDDPAGTVLEGSEPESWFAEQMAEIDQPIDALDRMTLSDALSYLTDDILQKVDRAAMSVSLETRVPFLDKDVVEFSCRVPPQMKVRNGQGKWLVRQVLDRHVPRHLIDRPKTGFSIPLDDWLRGPLKSVGLGFAGARKAQSPAVVQLKARRRCLGRASAGRTQSWLLAVECPDGTSLV